jgi:integrase
LHARSKRIATSYQLDSIKATFKKVENTYLSFEELDLIERLTDLPEYLINARDWLVISCYTGQRISDFMRFTHTMITTKNNMQGVAKSYLEFAQVKTGKDMTIPLHKKVLDILNQRNGEFPRRITDQKYNDYVKLVCRHAGVTAKVYGSKKTAITPGGKVYRKETGLFEKCELVSSHIGRRSFATNFYDKISTALLISATGHSTEAMFLNYIGKSKRDLAEALAEHF